MQHSVKEIGKRYAELSDMRQDKERFKSKEFFEFAEKNKGKYRLIENGDDLLVGTWYSNDLIEDYRQTLKQ